ncbi:MAG: hypothetical protein Q9219_001537 [cf. Caloplaca sp. 3 TL-2023]
MSLGGCSYLVTAYYQFPEILCGLEYLRKDSSQQPFLALTVQRNLPPEGLAYKSSLDSERVVEVSRNGIWSVQIKHPLLTIARLYTPLPPFLSDNPPPTSREIFGNPSSNPEENQLRFLIRNNPDGELSRYLSRMHAGGRLELRGPYQEFKLPEDVKHIVFFAGGTGISPAIQMVHSLLDNEAKVHKPSIDILWANRHAEDCSGGPLEPRPPSGSILSRVWSYFLGKDSPKPTPSAGTHHPESPIVTELSVLKRRYAGSLQVSYFADDQGRFITKQDVQRKLQGSTQSNTGRDSEKDGGKGLVLISGPDGFVEHFAGPKALSKRTTDQHHESDKLGATASESAVCSKIGVNLIKDGGNAADALVGTVFCIGVIGMYHSGIGGGGFMLVRASNGSYTFIDFRETAPAAAFQDMYINDTRSSIYGGLASGVPGELRGLEYLHGHFGKLPWPHVMQPAIDLARNGFLVTQDLVNYMDAATKGTKNFLVDEPTWAVDFAPNGTRVGLGDVLTRRRYANTLETISKQGANAFYAGPIANATIRALQAQNGTMTLTDLQNYTVAIRKPATITYRDFKLTSCSAPSSGVVALSALKTIEGYPDIGEPAAVNLSTHRLDEAIRFAYGERANLGDPLFVTGLDEYQNEMLNESTAARIRSEISDVRTLNVSAYDPSGLESLDTPGTSHIVAADASGMAISLTTTINLLFGSQLIVPETGVIMNNEMNDFSIPNSSNAFGYVPSPSNFIRPGKRPLSSISPTIVEFLANSTFYFAVGSAGGSRIITATIQNLWHVLDQGLSSAAALAEPRLHDQLQPNQVSFEYPYNNQTVAFMKSLGHNVTWIAPGASTAQALRRLPNGTFEAAGEPRQKASGGFIV